MPFQNQVNLTPAPAVAGDFASGNPRATVLAGPGGLVAGAGGVTVAKFAWVGADGVTVLNTGAVSPSGFVHREQQGLITAFLGETSMVVPVGFPITLHSAGDFFAKNEGLVTTTIGMPIFAVLATGAVVPAASLPALAIATIFYARSIAAVGELVKISTWGV